MEHIFSKYNDDLLNDFIFIPQLIAQRKVVYENEAARIRETNEVIPFFQRNPSQMKLGKDKKYFYDLYDYLCDFAHCNFSILYYYVDQNGLYTSDNVVNDFW